MGPRTILALLCVAALGAAAVAPVAAQSGRGRAAPPAKAPAAEPPRSEPPVVEESRGEADKRRSQAGIVVPRTNAGPVVTIPLADGVTTPRLASGELPPAWSLKRFAGRAQFELVREDGRPVFRLASQGSSFALHRDVSVDLDQFPILSWSWKVTRLPARGDVRDRTADDQAAQVYVIFPRSPSPRTTSDVLGYVWDTRAPAGLQVTNPRWSNVRVVVVESGEGKLGTWVQETRNARQDYVALFGHEPPAVGRIAVMTDSDNTRGQSEALFGDLAFRRAPAASSSEPTRSN